MAVEPCRSRAPTYAFLKAAKEQWKDCFQQLDMWITAHEIEIIE